MGVERFYDGILSPTGGLYQGTGDAGVYDGILPGAAAAPSGGLTSRSVTTVKIDPRTGQPVTPTVQPGMMGRGQPTPAVSPYMTAAEQALLERQIAQSRTLQAGYDANGAPKAPVTLAGMFGRGITLPGAQTQVASAGVPLPRVRPASAPWAPELAAAMSPDATLGDLLAYARSSSGGERHSGAAGAADDLAGATSGTSLSSLFGGPRASVRPADAYAAANALGVLNAQQKRSTLSGVGTNGYTYVDGKNVGYSAEEQTKRDALGKAIGDANRSSATTTYSASGENNSFMPTSYQNSVRQQTGY